MFINLTNEAYQVLTEVLENEKNSNYWINRFKSLSNREDSILRGCFKELSDNGLIKVMWADNVPYNIFIAKDAYLYDEHAQKEELNKMSQYEQELYKLVSEAENIEKKGSSISNQDEWLNDAEIFTNRYLKKHSLNGRISSLLFHRKSDAFNQVLSCMKSIKKDQTYTKLMKIENNKSMFSTKNDKSLYKDYDVFISHANQDKLEIIDELVKSLKTLGINIFYDKETLEWGDKWKDKIYEGTEKSEFAIIVISENFFDREWTEKELNLFLNRQNASGQKIILPILHNISIEQLAKKYPSIADIQALNSKDYTCDQIALLFSTQLIKRLKAI